MKLVIVESPHKCETIGKYLGKNYKVMASVGHLNDLATSGKGGFGVDIENGFKPTYVINSKKYSTVNQLKEATRRASEVILATDPDREGEAIAWHLTQILKLDPKTTKRLEFHEITEESINEAINNPRVINMDLVHSQEVRRIMDRIIGFKLSGIIQKKIKSRSAGRVQSATLKLIADHDKEIAEFKPEEYWTLSLDLTDGKHKITVHYLPKEENGKISNKLENDALIKKLDKKAKVVDIKKTIRTTESKPAFTTSTLQQEAFNALRMSTATTTKVAQNLYEGLNIGNEHVGLVTYIRTDNASLSNSFVEKAKAFIEEKYGKDFVGHRKFVKVNAAQNAHEAIRPTSIRRTPEMIRKYVSNEEYRLYKLIYERTIASLMKAKVDEVSTLIFDCGGVCFKTEGAKTIFDGYSRIYHFSEEEKYSLAPALKVGDELNVDKINNSQEFTKAPAYYNEAKIVKLMEEKGIGRPSTYASTIKTLKSREYVESKQGLIQTTESGKKTSFVLNKYFPKLVDTKYTAQMEKDLDKIQEGKATFEKTLSDFYYPFIKEFDEASKAMYNDEDEEVGRNCPICGAPLVRKKSRYGTFIGCSNFPECEYRENDKVVEYAPGTCPKCGKPLVYRYTKGHKKFVGCSGYPECGYIQKNDSLINKVVIKKCPECGGDLILRKKGRHSFLGCSNFPRCNHMEPYTIDENEK